MKNLRILIVEDDEDWRDILEEDLTRAGLQFLAAESFDHALQLARNSDVVFDGAIVDKGGKGSFRGIASFGYHDGLIVISALRENQPFCRTILLTGESFSMSAQQSGAFAFSDKGWLNKQRLLNEINKGPLHPNEIGQPTINISEHRSPRRPEHC